MAPPRPLASNADAAQLTQWLTEWSLQYRFAYDRRLRAVLRPASNSFAASDLKIIFDWKLGDQWKATAAQQVNDYERRYANEIDRKTGAAFVAADDAAARAALRELPQLKSSQVAALGSAILMCLDPDRWTVMDVNAKAALVCLRNTIGGQSTVRSAPLRDLASQLVAYIPAINRSGKYPAKAADWPSYVAICRLMAHETMLSLRTVGRT